MAYCRCPGLGAGPTPPETVETSGPGAEFLGWLLSVALGAALWS